MNSNIDALISRLDKVVSVGDGKWKACCPAHDDKSPSLAISDNNGKILLHCFAGCTALDVVHAVDMELQDLFPDDNHDKYRSKPNTLDQERNVLLIAAADAANGKQLNDRDLKARDVAFRRLHAAGKALEVMEEAKIIRAGGEVRYGNGSVMSATGFRSIK